MPLPVLLLILISFFIDWKFTLIWITGVLCSLALTEFNLLGPYILVASVLSSVSSGILAWKYDLFIPKWMVYGLCWNVFALAALLMYAPVQHNKTS